MLHYPGIRLPSELQEKWKCGKYVKFPDESATTEEVKLFKKAFLEYYYPCELKSDGYKLTGVTYKRPSRDKK